MKTIAGFCEKCADKSGKEVLCYIENITPLPSFDLRLDAFCPECQEEMSQIVTIVHLMEMCEENQEILNKEAKNEKEATKQKNS